MSPTRPPRRCTTPGCPGDAVPGTRTGKCPPCTQATPRIHRPSSTAQGYGTQHRVRFRAAVLRRDPRCVLCKTAPANEADHYPLSRRELVERGLDPDDPQHGRGLCKACHSSQTAEHQPGGWAAHPGPAY
ncbi:holin [Kitasatospora sp. NPDC002965]|uniref:holin n=1 Tax=Kitasatospora sp. NPDC002965 TaxID=3154775 RepID=UPI0033B86426